MMATVANDRLRRLISIGSSPLWAAQGIHTRLTIERLPEARGPQSGIVGEGKPPLKIGFIGESTVAGIGAHKQVNGLVGQTSRALSEQLNKCIDWQAAGANGATFKCTLPVLLPRLTELHYDVVVVALGVNDTVRLTSETAFLRHASALLHALRPRAELIAVTDIPPVGYFPSLPNPLRRVMGWRAMRLSTLLRTVVSRTDSAVLLPAEFDVADRALMASDGFHPSEAGYAVWGRQMAEAIKTITPPLGDREAVEAPPSVQAQ